MMKAAGPQGLQNACRDGNLEVVQALLAAGANKDGKNKVG